MKFFINTALTLVILLSFNACEYDLLSDNNEVTLEEISNLDDGVGETSGLEIIDGRVYTHNDGGGLAALYEIDINTGDILRTIAIDGATNVDWEGLGSDENYLYIADIGNNLGSRDDLKIYKVLKTEISNSDTASAQVISFSYPDQTLFSYANYTTPYDAEAIIVYDGSIYIFTKNWDDYTTQVYAIPTDEGEYNATFVAQRTFDVMITDADINTQTGEIALVGYENHTYTNSPKNNIIILSGFEQDNFFSGDVEEYETQSMTTFQVEAIVFHTDSELYLSSESLNYSIFDRPAKFYRLELDN